MKGLDVHIHNCNTNLRLWAKKRRTFLYDEVSFIRSDDRALVLAYSSTTCSSMSEYICKCAPTSEPGGVSIHGLLVIPWTGKDSERGSTAKRSFFMQKDLCALADTEELGKGEGHTTRHPQHRYHAKEREQQLSCSLLQLDVTRVRASSTQRPPQDVDVSFRGG